MNDLEQSVRQTLTARVSHLTDEHLDAETAVPTVRRRSMRAVVLPLAAAAAVAAIAVGVVVAVNSGAREQHPVTSPGPPLVGTEWQLESITHGTTYVTRGAEAMITFDGKGMASGRNTCNSFGGPVTIDGARMKFGSIGQTAMARSEVPGLVPALTSVDHWSIGNEKLRLTGSDGTVMTFHVRA